MLVPKQALSCQSARRYIIVLSALHAYLAYSSDGSSLHCSRALSTRLTAQMSHLLSHRPTSCAATRTSSWRWCGSMYCPSHEILPTANTRWGFFHVLLLSLSCAHLTALRCVSLSLVPPSLWAGPCPATFMHYKWTRTNLKNNFEEKEIFAKVTLHNQGSCRLANSQSGWFIEQER